MEHRTRMAIVTGGSRGLGRALVHRLAADGWTVVTDARRGEALDDLVAEVGGSVVAIAGDVTDPAHRGELVRTAARLGPIELLVNNASTLGETPLPTLERADLGDLRRTFEVNVIAPVALWQHAIAVVAPDATIVSVTSDAASEAYPTWGAYGASKSALEHASRVLAAEHPALRVLVVDPGDMRTEMHQAAFPDEDISDRPMPEASVPGLMGLINGDQPSGRYVVKQLVSS